MKSLIRFLNVILLIFISTTAFAYSNAWRPSTYFEKIEHARLIIIGSVHSVTTNYVDDGVAVDELFDIVKIEGNILDSNGLRSKIDSVKLRTPRGSFSQYTTGRYVFLLTGNDLALETHDDTFPWLFTPALRVEGNNLYVGGKILEDIDDKGHLDFMHINKCAISDFPVESEKRIRAEWGRMVPEYTREEIIRTVDSFQCPDDSQWFRDGRSEEQSRKFGIKLNKFESKLTQHLKSKNVSVTSDEQINRDVDRGSASKLNNIEYTKHLDAVLVPLLESEFEMRDKFSSQDLKKIFKRVERRRERFESGQANESIGLFNWDEYPNIKALLREQELID